MYKVNVTSPAQLPLVSGCQNSGGQPLNCNVCVLSSLKTLLTVWRLQVEDSSPEIMGAWWD